MIYICIYVHYLTPCLRRPCREITLQNTSAYPFTPGFHHTPPPGFPQTRLGNSSEGACYHIIKSLDYNSSIRHIHYNTHQHKKQGETGSNFSPEADWGFDKLGSEIRPRERVINSSSHLITTVYGTFTIHQHKTQRRNRVQLVSHPKQPASTRELYSSPPLASSRMR